LHNNCTITQNLLISNFYDEGPVAICHQPTTRGPVQSLHNPYFQLPWSELLATCIIPAI